MDPDPLHENYLETDPGSEKSWEILKSTKITKDTTILLVNSKLLNNKESPTYIIFLIKKFRKTKKLNIFDFRSDPYPLIHDADPNPDHN